MNANTTKPKNENKLVSFFKSIEFINDELSEVSKSLIHKQVLENKLEGFFNERFWRDHNGLQNILNIKEAIYFLEYIVSNFLEELSINNKINAFNNLIYFNIINKKYVNGLKLINKIEYLHEPGTENYINTLNYKGTIYKMLGRYNEALNAYYEAQKRINKINNLSNADKQVWISSINNNIGIVYRQQSDLDNALQIFEKNLTINKRIKNKANLLVCYANLANLYIQKNNFNKAISFYLSAKKCIDKKSENIVLDRINLNLAKIYIKANKLDLAQIYSNKCKESLHEIIRNETVLIDLEIVLKQVKNHGETSTTQKTIIGNLVIKSLEITEETEALENKIGNYLLLANAYESIKDFEQANKILNKRDKLYTQHVEQQKIESYKQIRESHEIQLQQKELEKKELLLKQKEALNIKLKQVNDELEQFTSMATHDLKSPLRTILALCGFMKQGDLEAEEMNEYLSIIEKDALKMDNLINSLLKYSRIGYAQVEMQKVSLSEIVSNTVKSLETEIKLKKADINLAALPTIQGNKILLEQLFQNLINNALKYNDKAQPVIHISTTENGIAISDNGIGIPSNKSNEIFKAFTRAHSASKYEGSGVGLATCKKIMDIHLGTISVRSEVGKGSVFTLQFS